MTWHIKEQLLHFNEERDSHEMFYIAFTQGKIQDNNLFHALTHAKKNENSYIG